MPVLSSYRNVTITDSEVERKEMNGSTCFSGDNYRRVYHEATKPADHRSIETSFISIMEEFECVQMY